MEGEVHVQLDAVRSAGAVETTTSVTDGFTLALLRHAVSQPASGHVPRYQTEPQAVRYCSIKPPV